MKQEYKMDDLLRSVAKSDGLEQPSADFTDRVMNFVKQESISKDTLQYRPFFSKNLWIAVACFVVGIIILNFVIPSGSSGHLFSGFGFIDSVLEQLNKLHLPFEMPAMLMLIMVCASIMLFMQMFLLGKFIKKNLQ